MKIQFNPMPLPPPEKGKKILVRIEFPATGEKRYAVLYLDWDGCQSYWRADGEAWWPDEEYTGWIYIEDKP